MPVSRLNEPFLSLRYFYLLMPARNPRIEHVIDYCGPEPGVRVFKKHPFSGHRVEQALDSGYVLSGPLLISQCRGKTISGRRCRHTTTYDYQFCSLHLLRDFHLMVAPSRIPHAGMGVFAVSEGTLRRLGKDEAGGPIPDASVVVFECGEPIGNGFGGEFMTDKAYTRRYGDNSSAYALTWYTDHEKKTEGPGIIDGFLARTVSSYCNDALNLTGNKTWSFQNNAFWGSNGLEAGTLICHGDEIFWSYGAGYWKGFRAVNPGIPSGRTHD